MDIEIIEHDAYNITIKKTDYNRLLALANEPTNNMMLNLIKSYEGQSKAEKEFRDKIYELSIKDSLTNERLRERIDNQSKVINILRELNELYESEWGVITFFRKLFYGTKT